MNILLLHPDRGNFKSQSIQHLLVPIYQPPNNTNEGSEFLDDALGMEDLLQIHTEESVAAGSPKDLL